MNAQAYATKLRKIFTTVNALPADEAPIEWKKVLVSCINSILVDAKKASDLRKQPEHTKAILMWRECFVKWKHIVRAAKPALGSAVEDQHFIEYIRATSPELFVVLVDSQSFVGYKLSEDDKKAYYAASSKQVVSAILDDSKSSTVVCDERNNAPSHTTDVSLNVYVKHVVPTDSIQLEAVDVQGDASFARLDPTINPELKDRVSVPRTANWSVAKPSCVPTLPDTLAHLRHSDKYAHVDGTVQAVYSGVELSAGSVVSAAPMFQGACEVLDAAVDLPVVSAALPVFGKGSAQQYQDAGTLDATYAHVDGSVPDARTAINQHIDANLQDTVLAVVPNANLAWGEKTIGAPNSALAAVSVTHALKQIQSEVEENVPVDVPTAEPDVPTCMHCGAQPQDCKCGRAAPIADSEVPDAVQE